MDSQHPGSYKILKPMSHDIGLELLLKREKIPIIIIIQPRMTESLKFGDVFYLFVYVTGFGIISLNVASKVF